MLMFYRDFMCGQGMKMYSACTCRWAVPAAEMSAGVSESVQQKNKKNGGVKHERTTGASPLAEWPWPRCPCKVVASQISPVALYSCLLRREGESEILGRPMPCTPSREEEAKESDVR
jgi:hypothetical protein